jgi:type II secretory pathway pseudopilin PulG
MRYIKKLTKNAQNQLGDTIVEVLLAIGIAAFAIGISYATAQRSLDKSITAREHNQALNLIENQIADLKLRFKNTPATTFNATFASPNTDFCLNDTASDPANTATWNPYMNNGPNGPPAIDKPLALKNASAPNNGPYDAGCQNQQPGDGADYFIDITTKQGSSTGPDNTLYTITVRWSPVGGSQTNQASINYKLNGSNGLSQ